MTTATMMRPATEEKTPDGFVSEDEATASYSTLDLSNAIEAYLRGIPGASYLALREGLKRQGVDSYHKVGYWALMDSNALFLTANTDTVYSMTFLDLSPGEPMVVEAPAGAIGFLNDIWGRYICDLGSPVPPGKPQTVLVLPPDSDADDDANPPAVSPAMRWVRSPTYSVWVLARGSLQEGKYEPAVDMLKEGLKIYPLSEIDNPPEMEFIDLSGKKMNTLHRTDDHLFQEIADLVNEEPAEALDPESLGLFASIGIRKGEPMDMDPELAEKAAEEGLKISKSLLFYPRDPEAPQYTDPENSRQWLTGFIGGNHEFLREDGSRNLDARTMFYYFATGTTPAMVKPRVGKGSVYLWTCRDKDGNLLDGSKTYQLHYPGNVPAENFWSIVVYDPDSRSMLKTPADLSPSLNSYSAGLQGSDEDGYTFYFGPTAPDGQSANWIETDPTKGWFTVLRFYGPKQEFLDQEWIPGDIELMP